MEGWLFRASRLLYAELLETSLPYWKSVLDVLVQAYSKMTEYLEKGAQDEERAKVLDYLKVNMLEVSDALYREKRKQTSSEQYYTTLRVLESQGMPETFYTQGLEGDPQELFAEDRFAFDNRLSALFDYLWVSEELSEELSTKVSSMSEYARQLLISSLTLGLLYHWDIQKVRFLLSELGRKDISIRYQVRLFFGIILVFYIHPQRCNLYATEINEKLSLANELHPLAPLFSALEEAFLLSSDTERVTQIVEKNLPEIIRANQKSNNLSATLFELDSDETGAVDPELKALEEKVKELGKLEEEGADTLYVAFKNFKRLPFFNAISSWFLPFDPKHSAIRELYEENALIQKLMPYFQLKMCDGDLYSAILSLPNRIQPLNLQDPNLALMLDEMNAPTVPLTEDTLPLEARRYVQDFYRFVKLSTSHNIGADLFDKLPLRDFPLLSPFISLEHHRRKAVLFYMSRERYREAMPLLEKIVAENPADATSLARLGYIHYKRGHYKEAIACFEKSDLVEDLSQQLRILLAHSYRKEANYDKAIAIYEQYRKTPSILLAMAATYILSGAYEKAIPLLHEYIYRSDTPHRAYRSLAWSYFMEGDYERSEEYHQKIVKPNANDSLNKLYLFIAKKELAKAFHAAVELVESGKMEEICRGIENDLPQLESKGITQKTITLLLDAALLFRSNAKELTENETNKE